VVSSDPRIQQYLEKMLAALEEETKAKVVPEKTFLGGGKELANALAQVKRRRNQIADDAPKLKNFRALMFTEIQHRKSKIGLGFF
jgi:hypothetical protein